MNKCFFCSTESHMLLPLKSGDKICLPCFYHEHGPHFLEDHGNDPVIGQNPTPKIASPKHTTYNVPTSETIIETRKILWH